MIQLNDTNGASTFTFKVAEKLMNNFDQLTGAEFGVAYGGGVERIGKLWGSRGTIYGFDTFTGHPKEIGEVCKHTKAAGGRNAFAATCMDSWYENPDYGTDRLSYEYQRAELDRQGLSNVILVKGLITNKTKLPFDELHYCFLDLDFPLSMWHAYNLVKDKIVKGGYLCLHDVIPEWHIPGCYEYYQKILQEGLFEIESEEACLLAVLKKI